MNYYNLARNVWHGIINGVCFLAMEHMNTMFVMIIPGNKAIYSNSWVFPMVFQWENNVEGIAIALFQLMSRDFPSFPRREQEC